MKDYTHVKPWDRRQRVIHDPHSSTMGTVDPRSPEGFSRELVAVSK